MPSTVFSFPIRAALCFAGLSGLFCVAMGAAASHVLTSLLEPVALQRVEKAVTYQFYHTFALLAAVMLHLQTPHRIWRIAAMLFALGIFAFSGSLYLRAFFPAAGIPSVAPFGGVAWMAGWASMAFGALLVQRSK